MTKSTNLKDVEADGLRKRSALADMHVVSFLDAEARRYMGGYVLVPLLETVVPNGEKSSQNHYRNETEEQKYLVT